jgi:hypothetical protein
VIAHIVTRGFDDLNGTIKTGSPLISADNLEVFNILMILTSNHKMIFQSRTHSHNPFISLKVLKSSKLAEMRGFVIKIDIIIPFKQRRYSRL